MRKLMKKNSDFPIVSFLFMIIVYFGIGTTLLLIPSSTPVLWGMDIPSLIIGYFGYIFLILACIYHAKTNK